MVRSTTARPLARVRSLQNLKEFTLGLQRHGVHIGLGEVAVETFDRTGQKTRVLRDAEPIGSGLCPCRNSQVP